MNYSEEFKAEARRVFPLKEELHKAIGAGKGARVGSLIRGATPNGIAPETILKEGQTLELLRAKAQQILDKKKLYRMWYAVKFPPIRINLDRKGPAAKYPYC